MTARSYYFRIPLVNTEFCFSYWEQNTRLGFAVEGYPDGTTQMVLGRWRARMSPGAKSAGSTRLIFH